MKITLDLKRRCAEAYEAGTPAKEIYNEIFLPEHQGMSLASFRRKIQIWTHRYKSELIPSLSGGTYEGFVAHDATVQVDGNGKITQAWIKQSASDVNWEELIDNFKQEIIPLWVQNSSSTCKMLPQTHKLQMLEIPLFDMHFGVAKFSDYENILGEIIDIINNNDWDEINILFGQDVLHTNDMRGHTAKGTEIGIIDFKTAWNDCYQFFGNILQASLERCSKVNLRYSKGNHDECSAWCMLKTLEAKFPQIFVDDNILPRKCLLWENCFIGYGHCEYRNSKNGLFRDFVVDFPLEFANSKVREIHCGHLHSESIDDGIMVRRLASGVPADEWSKNNGYIGSHKRFQLFIWNPSKLKSILYIGE